VASTNCTISVRDYGKRDFRVLDLHHGISVVHESSGNTRHGRDWFARVVTSGSFSMRTIFPSYESYKEAAEWLKGWGDRASSPAPTAGIMRITLPERNMDRLAVLAGTSRGGPSGISFGRRWNGLTYEMNLAFVGTSNPASLSVTSKFERPTEDSAVSKYFYPNNYTPGRAAGEVNLYDSPFTVGTGATKGVR
jgi:hypothetical protein